MTEQDLVRLIDEARDFPGLSPLAAEIARMTSDLSAPVQKIAEKIHSDDTLVEPMLRVINSPFYGLSGEVTDISVAISLLGYKRVCNLAVGVSVPGLVPSGSAGGFNYTRFWERSICSGVAAGEVAARLSADQPADLFTAGLLQDLGVLFLVRCRPLEYGAAIGISRAQGVHVVKAERKVLGIDHALVGALLCRKWQVPGLLSELIRFQHFVEFPDPVPPGIQTMVQVVTLSNLITDVLFERDVEEKRTALDQQGKAFFGFGPKMINAILEKVLSQAQEVGQAFSIQVDAKPKPSEEEKARVQFADTCPKCKATEQKGKFCSQCGASLKVGPAVRPRSTSKILVAEDSIASRRALCFVIKKMGFVPVEATNGYEALELAKKEPPGMIMLDVMMPRMNGLEALKKIREERTTSDIPVVMLTSLTDSETVVEAVQAGANDYVVKPYTADIIAQRVKKYMPKGAR